MRHLRRRLHEGRVIRGVVYGNGHGHVVVVQSHRLLCRKIGSSASVDLVTLHHECKFLINLVVLGLGAWGQGVVLLAVWGVGRL